MKISYAITVCNEFVEIQRLINFLLKNKRQEDEIVVLYDQSHGDPEIESFLRSSSINNEFKWYPDNFENHFADWKNKLTSLCSGDYIFQIDADELPTTKLVDLLPHIIQQNVDIVLVPRSNTVKGLTDEHIKKWGWSIDNLNRVNWPDYQWRIYRNCPEIKWVNKVHEKLEGFKTYSTLPSDMSLGAVYLNHPKTIEKQEKQNNLYDNL
jgi:hypothetical protein